MRVCFLIFIAFLLGCHSSQKITAKVLPTVNISASKNRSVEPLRETRALHMDLIHTTLKLTPVWETEQMNGEAILTLKPYYYSTNQFSLDAKKFDFHDIKLFQHQRPLAFTYQYDSLMIHFQLEKSLSSKDTVEVRIKYTANPNKIEKGGSRAIKEEKGLYFINADGKDSKKPRHFWTQGETQSNSGWFPTIDQPNEKHTQEVQITIEKDQVSLSNGLLINTQQHANGTKTDTWKQTLPHSVYLTVLVVGNYEIVKDEWRGKEVLYYMEPKYKEMARPIFGRTPEMMEYFSNLLGVTYPWDKYAQVIVHDFVAGAMENTSAVTFQTFVQKDHRELLDQNDDETVAHELCHHWFGDLVTCESWSHLPLNESFANYSEYLWYEYKYGKAAADAIAYKDLDEYLKQSNSKVQPLIRFDYKSQEDMFDVLSYNKGGRILHQLRKQIGDAAFFEGLKLYLSRYAYKTAEVHNLRQCFEEVTGMDLNRYFNQWFFVGGHPIIECSYQRSQNGVQIITSQKHNIDDYFLYELPLQVDVYLKDTVIRKQITLEHIRDTFSFEFKEPVEFVNIDADKTLVGEKVEEKTMSEWIAQFRRAPLYVDKFEALRGLKDFYKEEEVQRALTWGMSTTISPIVAECIRLCNIAVRDSGKIDKLEWLAAHHAKGLVRAAAIEKLASIRDYQNEAVFNKALLDSSYKVEAEALSGLSYINAEKGKNEAVKRMNQDNFTVKLAVLNVLSQYEDSTLFSYFKTQINDARDYRKAYMMGYFGVYCARQNWDVYQQAITFLKEYQETYKNEWYGKSGFASAINNAKKILKKEKSEIADKKLTLLQSIQ